MINPDDDTNLPIGNMKKIWAIGGGKGGVGKSLVSANVAICLALMGNKVVAVDLDLAARGSVGHGEHRGTRLDPRRAPRRRPPGGARRRRGGPPPGPHGHAAGHRPGGRLPGVRRRGVRHRRVPHSQRRPHRRLSAPDAVMSSSGAIIPR